MIIHHKTKDDDGAGGSNLNQIQFGLYLSISHYQSAVNVKEISANI